MKPMKMEEQSQIRLRSWKHLTKPLKVEEQIWSRLHAYKHLTKPLKVEEQSRTVWAPIPSLKWSQNDANKKKLKI